jgi:mycothiol system anti-sigma-R factor
MTAQCKKYFQKISEYLDGELDKEICQKIRQHLQGCPECRRCLDSLRKTIDLCKEAGREKIPSDAQERLRSTLREFLGYE